MEKPAKAPSKKQKEKEANYSRIRADLQDIPSFLIATAFIVSFSK